jgi:hypothetical protein
LESFPASLGLLDLLEVELDDLEGSAVEEFDGLTGSVELEDGLLEEAPEAPSGLEDDDDLDDSFTAPDVVFEDEDDLLKDDFEVGAVLMPSSSPLVPLPLDLATAAT